jgi:hypothetical protein
MYGDVVLNHAVQRRDGLAPPARLHEDPQRTSVRRVEQRIEASICSSNEIALDLFLTPRKRCISPLRMSLRGCPTTTAPTLSLLSL